MFIGRKYKKKIIAVKNNLILNCLGRRIIAVVLFCLVFINFLSFAYSQTENTTAEGYNRNNNLDKEYIQKPQDEAKFRREYHTRNLAPLTFKDFPFKPVYSGTINQKDSKESRKAMAIILESSESSNPLIKKLSDSQSKNANIEVNRPNENEGKIYVNKPPEAKFRIVFHTKNLAPLTFITFPLKPVYSGIISPGDEKDTRKATSIILENSKSSNPLTKNISALQFNINEQKQKDRENQKKVMLAYNERNKQKLRENFERFQKMRSQTGNYSGMHYDYTSYNKNFLVNTSR